MSTDRAALVTVADSYGWTVRADGYNWHDRTAAHPDVVAAAGSVRATAAGKVLTARFAGDRITVLHLDGYRIDRGKRRAALDFLTHATSAADLHARQATT